tara:strand:- start:24007 stop:24327 length:321 start_codon:yes stop_codon:yes gene_type:complete
MTNDDEYLLPTQDIGPTDPLVEQAGKEIFQVLIAKFDAFHIAEILKHLGQQYLHYVQMRVDVSKEAHQAQAEMDADGRALDIGGGKGIIMGAVLKESADGEGEEET